MDFGLARPHNRISQFLKINLSEYTYIYLQIDRYRCTHTYLRIYTSISICIYTHDWFYFSGPDSHGNTRRVPQEMNKVTACRRGREGPARTRRKWEFSV